MEEYGLTNGTCKRYPKFFKVYLPQLGSEKLMVAPEFARKFGNQLSNVATLTGADGRVWQLGLTKTENNIFFHDGWHEFVDHYSILQGYFLVFSYKGLSNFHISIFDTSACEVDYLFNGQSSENDRNNDEQDVALDEDDMKDEGGFDIFDISSASVKRVSRKRSRDKVMKKRCNTLSKKGCYPSIGSGGSSRNKNGYETRSKKCKIEDTKENTDVDNTNEKSQYKTSQKTKDRIQHPKETAKNFQPLVPDWSVQMNQSKHKSYKKTNASFYDVQLARTADDGAVQPVHAVKHEFSVKSEDDFGVIVSRHFPKECTKISQNGKRALQAAKLFKPENPSFMVILSRWNFVAASLYVPVEFVRKYLRSGLNSLTVRDSNGREWPFKTRHRISGGLVLTKGWSKFSMGNNLEKEDVCIFELIKTDNIVLKVSTFHTSGHKLSAKSEHDVEIVVGQQFSRMYAKMSQKGKRAVHAAKLFKPQNPSFMIILVPSTFAKNTMSVPSEFARKYLSRDSKYLTVVDWAGRNWLCTVKWGALNALDLSRGVCDFVRYHTLKEEDVCVFELLKTDDVRLKLSIFRAN